MLKKFRPYLFMLLFSCTTIAQSSYYFENKEIKPGTKEHFLIPVSTENNATLIPITVFNGIKNGKTLGITAGVHGYELSPIMAAQKLITSIDPAKLSGVVILVQIANLESFLGRSPYVSPVDGKNLGRTFPGSKDGTNTEKIADYITQNIIAKADYFLDMHSGDAPEDLIQYGAYYSNAAMPEISKTGREMAIALGFDRVVVFNTDGKKYMHKNELSLYCTAEAFKRGIPSIDIECGRLGIMEESAVKKNEQSVIRLLEHLNFLSLKSQKNKTKEPLIISDRIYTESKFDGIFYPEKKAGEYVKKGMKLGCVTNYFGEVLQTVYAEDDGLLMLIISTPAINKGESLTVIGKI
ncbi:M14 family metallopeptidase [Flavobacterium gelatinilyticum]|uniref:M14 family metallopeptidase n=1 Tax=Flavobacterium gelatinilyticum TaxID=3003260 RepID=UPI0024819835|nr:M14 family metallopeptidase [Flavobacterium gelatinilyticum]